MRVAYSIDIVAPIDVAFECLDNIEKHPLWMDGLIETRYVSGVDRSNRVGTELTMRFKKGRRVVEWSAEIIAREKPTLFGLRICSGEFTTSIHYRLREAEKGTRLECESELEMLEGNLVTRMLSRMAAHHSKREKAALKALAEREASDGRRETGAPSRREGPFPSTESEGRVR